MMSWQMPVLSETGFDNVRQALRKLEGKIIGGLRLSRAPRKMRHAGGSANADQLTLVS